MTGWSEEEAQGKNVGRIDLRGQTFYENRPTGGACVRVTFPVPALDGAQTYLA